MSDYYNLGLDDLGLSGGSVQTASSSSLLGDFWADTKSILEEGIGIAGDLAGIKTAWNEATNGDYSQQYQPADEQHLSNLNSEVKATAAQTQWVTGVPNAALLLGGAGLMVAVFAMARG